VLSVVNGVAQTDRLAVQLGAPLSPLASLQYERDIRGDEPQVLRGSVAVGLGGNDFLRRAAPGTTREALAQIVRSIQAANAQARATDTAARDRAADQRLTDLKINNRLEKERTDAVSSIPDARPTAGRVALACHRLREQGTRDADLPAECRPGR
jgi:hypothetical protein